MLDVKKLSFRYPAILLFGPPGSGKGTLGKTVGAQKKYFHLSSGDIFRSLAKDSAAGQLYHSFAGKGLLLPDEATLDIWHAHVQDLIQSKQYDPHTQILLLDGIPRTSIQAEMIQKYIEVLHILVLHMPDTKVLIERIKKRALIEKRVDDMDESILKTRLQIYEATTKHLLQVYDPQVISYVNADQTPAEVVEEAFRYLQLFT